MREATFKILDYHEFDKLVNEHFKLPKQYQCVPCEEWNNDSDHAFENIEGKLDKWEKENLEAAKNEGEFGYGLVGVFLNQLVVDGVFQPGNYMIEVCW